MNVVLIAGNKASGGLINYIRGLICNTFIRNNDHFILFCGYELSKMFSSTSSNLTIIATPYANERGIDVILNKKLSKSFIELIDSYSPDIILFLNGYIRRGLGKYPNVMILHNQLYIDFKQLIKHGFSLVTISLLLFRLQVIRSLKKASGTIFLSEMSRKQTTSKGIKFNMSVVTHFGVEQSIIGNNKKNVNFVNPIKFLYVSAFYKYKNHVNLIKALHLIDKKGIDFSLLLVGNGDKKTKNKVVRHIKRYSLTNKIVILEWVNHNKVNQLIDECDIYLYLSSIETTGLGVIEGMARGSVIASSDMSCMPEILQDGGIYFSPDNITNISDQILLLINNYDLRKEISTKAKEISGKYDWKNTVNETMLFLENIISNNKEEVS